MRLSAPDRHESRSDWGGAALGHSAYSIYQALLKDQAHFQGQNMKYLQVINDIRELYHRATLRTEGGSIVFKGGHVEVEDNKMFYRYWRSILQQGQARGALELGSHPTKVMTNNLKSYSLTVGEMYYLVQETVVRGSKLKRMDSPNLQKHGTV